MFVHGCDYVLQDLDYNPTNIGASTIALKLPVRKEIKIASDEICIWHECLGKNGTKCVSDP